MLLKGVFEGFWSLQFVLPTFVTAARAPQLPQDHALAFSFQPFPSSCGGLWGKTPKTNSIWADIATDSVLP
jgi:hypothetical protein